MTSIYERALGADFQRLHPRIQERFSLSSTSRRAARGHGVMDEVRRGAFYTLPFLILGSWRHILFPEQGRNVPFQVENWAYVDPLGRETVTWLRTFDTGRRRRFDAYMIFSEERGKIIDYLGTHQHLAVDIELSVDERGGLRLRSGAQRFYEGLLGFPFPSLFTGVAEVCEWFDEDLDRFRIQVEVRNPIWGRLFAYRGSFEVEWIDAPDGPPPEALPRRVERRT